MQAVYSVYVSSTAEVITGPYKDKQASFAFHQWANSLFGKAMPVAWTRHCCPGVLLSSTGLFTQGIMLVNLQAVAMMYHEDNDEHMA